MLFSKNKETKPIINETEEPFMEEVNDVETEETKIDEKETSKKEPSFSKYSNVDFKRMSQEKMFSVIVELILENKYLFQENSKLNDEICQYNEELKGSKKNTDSVSGKIDYIAQKICPSLITMLNNGSKLTIDMKCNIIINSILKEKQNLLTQLLQEKQRVKQQKIVLDELKAQLAERIEVRNTENIEEYNTEYNEKDFETYAGTRGVTNENISTLQGSVAIKAIDLDKARACIDDTGKKIIEAIGKEGISEYPSLLQYCLKANIGITESKFDTACDNLKLNSIVDVDVVQSFNRLRGIRVFSLSNEVGKSLYQEIFRSKPVISEKEKIKRENDNLSHGYSIKDVVNQLEEFGYTEISMDRKTNTIPISGANVWIPDIIANNPVSGRKEYIEVEMGTHNTENFNLKMDKANLKVSVLKIIVANKSVAEKICRKIDDWKALNPKKTQGITIYVQRFLEFKNKEDGKVFAPADKLTLKDAKDIINNKKTSPQETKTSKEINPNNTSEEDDV